MKVEAAHMTWRRHGERNEKAVENFQPGIFIIDHHVDPLGQDRSTVKM